MARMGRPNRVRCRLVVADDVLVAVRGYAGMRIGAPALRYCPAVSRSRRTAACQRTGNLTAVGRAVLAYAIDNESCPGEFSGRSAPGAWLDGYGGGTLANN